MISALLKPCFSSNMTAPGGNSEDQNMNQKTKRDENNNQKVL